MAIEIDHYATGTIIILVFVILSIIGAIGTRKIQDIKKLLSHHEVMGYFFPVAGSIYGVLLGLIVVNSITAFNESNAVVNNEASDLISIYLLSNNLDPDTMQSIQKNCRDYANTVIDNEWKTMDSGYHDPTAKRHLINLFDGIIKSSKKGDLIAQKMLDIAEDMWKSRRYRLNIASTPIPTIEWVALCLGGILIILLSYMFVMDSLHIQILATTSVSIMIALNLYLVVSFGNPFSGDLRVSNASFKNALDTFSEIDNHTKNQPKDQ